MVLRIKNLRFAQDAPFVLIAGPCQIESRAHALMMAEQIADIAARHSQGWVFKSSFDKANRTAHSAARGVGIDEGTAILAEIGMRFGVPTITDIHEPAQAAIVAPHVDILQIPAFLSRQTDLLIAAGQTGNPVMVKKGQFLAPQDMDNVAAKIAATGNHQILLAERGASFGYNNLVSDMRSLVIMARTGYPVVFDATHSTQMPGGLGTASGADRHMAPVLARAALAVGVAGVFVEVHEAPDTAPSDAAAMLTLPMLAQHLPQWQALDRIAKGL